MTQDESGSQDSRPDLNARAIDWLEDQQKADREQLGSALDQLERLGQQVHELTSRLELVEDERIQYRSVGPRVQILEDAASGLRDSSADLRQSLDDIQKQGEHQALLRGTELDHDRRAIAELSQQVNDQRRQSESLHGRVQAISEEIRRDRSSADQIPVALDGVSRQIAALVSRTQQLEDYRRRADDQSSSLTQSADQIRGDITKLDNWQRLADVRWTRLSGELQEQSQAVKHQMDEQVKPVQQVGRLIKQVQEESAGVSAQLHELRKRVDDQFVSAERLSGQVSILREAIARVDQTQETQRRRTDEAAASVFRLDEGLQRLVAENADLLRRLEIQDSRIDVATGQIKVAEAQQVHQEKGLATVQGQLRDLRLSVAEDLALTRDQSASGLHSIGLRVASINQVELRQRERALALLQQDVSEWSGRVPADDEAPGDSTSVSADRRQEETPR